MVSERLPYPILISLASGMFALGTAATFIIGVDTLISNEFQLSPGATGTLISAFAFTYATAAPTLQWALGGRLPRRTLILIGLALLAAGSFWGALAGGMSELLLSRCVAAIGGALVGSTSLAAGAALVPTEQRGRALSVILAGFTLRSMLGVPLAGWLASTLGWRQSMAAIALFSLVAAFAVAMTLHDPGQEQRLQLRTFWKLATVPEVAGPILASCGQVASQFVVYCLLITFLREAFHLPTQWIALSLIAFGIGGVAGNILSGLLSDRIGPGRTIVVSFAILAVALPTLWLPMSAGYGVAVMATCALGGTLYAAPQQAYLAGVTPEDSRAVVFALNASAGYLGIALGSGIGAATYNILGLAAMPAVALVVLGAAFLLFVLTAREFARSLKS